MMKTYQTNVVGPLLVTQAFMPLLNKKQTKAVINISSILGSISLCAQNSVQGLLGYRCSKTALNMSTQFSYWVLRTNELVTSAFASDFKKEGFTFLAVHPGWLKTEMGGEAAPLDVSVGASGVYKVLQSYFLF